MNNRSGQSIMEIVVSMAIGILLIVGAVATISPILKVSGDVGRIQTGSALGKELLENVRAASGANWHFLDGLSTSSVYRYYIVASTSPFSVVTGTESLAVSTTTYTRWFFLDDVYRNPSAQIDSSGSLDPSTRKITVVYGWNTNATNTIVSYLTRSQNEVFFMTDWSNGGNQEGPITVTSTGARFATSTGIDYTAYPGSIVLTGF